MTEREWGTAIVLWAWTLGILAGGILDTWLALSDRVTVSDKVWGGNWLLGVAVILYALIGPAYLAWHFWLEKR